MPSARWRPWLAGIVATALTLRVVYVLAFAEDPPGLGDAAELHGLANALADGRGFVNPFSPAQDAAPTAHKPPLYPMMLAVVSALGATSALAHQLASAVIGTVTVLVIALLGRAVAGPRAGLVAGTLAALYPVLIARDGSLHSETPYTLLIATAVLLALGAQRQPSARRYAVLGAIVGLAALTRAEGILLLVLLVVPSVILSRHRRVRHVTAAAVACAVVLTPWLVRCWVTFDRPVAITTSSGDLLAGANCDDAYYGAFLGQWAFRCVLGASGDDEVEVAERLRRRGLEYAREHADRLAVVATARTLRPWGLFHPSQEVSLQHSAGGGPVGLGWVGLVSCWALVAGAFAGALSLRRRPGELAAVVAPIVLVVIVSVTSYGILRFRAAADVSLVVLAAVAIDALAARLSRAA